MIELIEILQFYFLLYVFIIFLYTGPFQFIILCSCKLNSDKANFTSRFRSSSAHTRPFLQWPLRSQWTKCFFKERQASLKARPQASKASHDKIKLALIFAFWPGQGQVVKASKGKLDFHCQTAKQTLICLHVTRHCLQMLERHTQRLLAWGWSLTGHLPTAAMQLLYLWKLWA